MSHDLIAAGHPRLAFELRSFKLAEPPHWHDRFAHPDGADTSRQNATSTGRLDPLDEWALGRAGALRSFLEQVAVQSAAPQKRTTGSVTADVWPEFTTFDCYGCHQPAIPPLDRSPATTSTGPLGVPRLDPLHWSLLELVLPAETAATLHRFRTSVEPRWWQPPEASAIDECLAALDAVRLHRPAPFADLSTAAAADRVVAGVDPARWNEVVAALAAITAIVDRAATRGVPAADLAAARERLTVLRGLLEFAPAERTGERERFDSPHDYDPLRVAAALEAAAASLRGVP